MLNTIVDIFGSGALKSIGQVGIKHMQEKIMSKRFEVVYDQRVVNRMKNRRETHTGVNYLWSAFGSGASMTPLLDAEDNGVVTEEKRQWV